MNWIYSIPLYLQILLGALAFLFIIQLMIWCFRYARLYRVWGRPATTTDEALPPLSVLLFTKDSGALLERCLTRLFEQDYPAFEVIVIHEKSAGEDEDILKRFSLLHPHLYYTFIPETARYISRKKLGLSVGMKAAKYDWVVLTEPNCEPVSTQWLRSLMQAKDEQTEIILGYNNYHPKKGCFATRILNEHFFYTLRYLSAALGGAPYMGSGRNLAFKKQLYMERRGEFGHINLVRGEDDLFINRCAHKRNTRVALLPDSIVRIEPPFFHQSWYSDRMHLMLTSHYYKGISRYVDTMETFSAMLFHLCWWAGVGVSIYFQQWTVLGVVVAFGVIRHFALYTILYKTARKVKEKTAFSLFFFDWMRTWWALQMRLKYIFRDQREYLRK